MRVPASATYLVGLVLLAVVQPYLREKLGDVALLVLAVPYLIVLIFLGSWLRDGRMRASAQEIFLIGLIPLAIAQPYAKQAFAGVEVVLLAVAYLVVLRLASVWLHNRGGTQGEGLGG